MNEHAPPRVGAVLPAPIPKLTGQEQGNSTSASLQAACEIHALRLVQAPFGKVFWYLEQRIARIADEIERTQS